MNYDCYDVYDTLDYRTAQMSSEEIYGKGFCSLRDAPIVP